MTSRDDTPPATDPGASLLLTDLYQLTMLQSYLEHGMTGTAVFEFLVRRLPGRRCLSHNVGGGLFYGLAYLAGSRIVGQGGKPMLGWFASSSPVLGKAA